MQPHVFNHIQARPSLPFDPPPLLPASPPPPPPPLLLLLLLVLLLSSPCTAGSLSCSVYGS
ncbi:hypothetical protein BDZ90DRAFT_234949 [Jaminaea rosea]|uniref:Uncharacterized protein n=1 Tax=Jaminaea rosea TaxID=1569628 RepID=A0A316UGI8_9BASI|nr:hypothetical protein BDZ90DRAFT_234949 [Jaminaea rosea]PWN24382.1 hypothetical protein BDZ90DRAFT_234949 [Jaminaea rosea]